MTTQPYGKKLEAYYASEGNADLAQLQARSNKTTASIHPIAVLNFSSSEQGNFKNHEISFYKTPDGKLEALIMEIFQDKVPKKVLLSEHPISEDQIIHTGYMWNTKVSNMSEGNKKQFIENISKMKIFNIDNENNLYLY